MPTYNFVCKNEHSYEAFCKMSERQDQKCPECGSTGKQVILTPPVPHWTSLAMGEGASPEAIRKFDKMRREQKDKETKTMQEHGDYGKSPGS